ncbi:MAG: transmembrane sensor [Polaribacter sp.]|jgi:transmembrane sensor
MLKDDELLHKWVNKSLSPEELETFKARPNYESLRRLYKLTDQMAVPEFDGESVLGDILETNKRRGSEKEEKGIRRSMFRLAGYAAASAVFLGVLWFMWPESSVVKMKLANGEKIEGFLPDESLFALNAGSTMSYDMATWATDRTLKLDGEAYFEVKKGATFKVETKNGTVKVLGTQFNVRSRKGSLEVKCKEGKVAVLSPEGVLLDELEMNDALRVKSGKVAKKWRFIGQQEKDWVSGNTSFKNVKLEVVLAELERQFDVKILSNKIDAKEVISCNFQQEDLNLALMTSLGALDILFEIRKDGTVYLYK